MSITLYDRSNRRDHGGDTISFEGKTVIPEGSVKGTYEGPCPPGWGASPNYELTVKAIDRHWESFLGSAKKLSNVQIENIDCKLLFTVDDEGCFLNYLARKTLFS